MDNDTQEELYRILRRIDIISGNLFFPQMHDEYFGAIDYGVVLGAARNYACELACLYGELIYILRRFGYKD